MGYISVDCTLGDKHG